MYKLGLMSRFLAASLTLAFACVGLPAQECRFTLLSPAQPPLKVLEGEKATESETFQTGLTAVSPDRQVYFFDTTSRIRRITPDGRMQTVAGDGTRTDVVTPGNARAAGLPAVGQLVFSRDGVLHFSAAGQVYRVRGGSIERVAGSGRPGFNGEQGDPLDVNLGSVSNFAFSFANELMIVDGYNRVRRVDRDGVLRTIAGSTRLAATAGLTGDGGPALQAALSNPRQVIPFMDGSYWIRDLGGRHIRLVGLDGVIRTVNQSFDTAVGILQFPDGSPGASSSNRVYPIGANGIVETGRNPFAPFTGTPRAIDRDGALYFEGSTRPDERAPLLRLTGTRQDVLAGAPVPPVVEGQAPPFGVWNPRTNNLTYAANLSAYSAIVEARAGQSPRGVVGGGDHIGDAGGKQATDLRIYGIAAFTVDNEGHLIVGDSYRLRLLVVETDGRVSVLKNAAGEDIVYRPMGTLSSLQKIAADSAGNIYWFSAGATPTGGTVFEAEVAVWSRASRNVTTFPVTGLYHLIRLNDGTVGVIAGNASSLRRIYRVTPAGLGDALAGTSMMGYGAYTYLDGTPYFTAAGSRLFRGEFGRMEVLELTALPSGATFAVDFVLSSPVNVIVHLTDGGFYRLEDPSACRWIPQPRIDSVLNAANNQNPWITSPRQLIRVTGTGLGPVGGNGFVLDGALRATGQAAPYPALAFSTFTGSTPFATLSTTTLPVLYSDENEAIYQAPGGVPADRAYYLTYSWQGATIVHPERVRVEDATPALFASAALGDAFVAMAENAEGDKVSRIGVENPAATGSSVKLFATGLGNLTNNLANGQFCPATPVAVTLPVEVTIGGEPAEVRFAGCQPDTIAGIYQILIKVPDDLSAGNHPITLRAGTADMAAVPRMVLPVSAAAQ